MQHTIKNYDKEICTELPPCILREYKSIALHADIFFSNRLQILAAIAKHLGFI